MNGRVFFSLLVSVTLVHCNGYAPQESTVSPADRKGSPVNPKPTLETSRPLNAKESTARLERAGHPLPEDPTRAPQELQVLWRQSRHGNAAVREKALGRLIRRIPNGMARERVEEWLGKGTNEKSEGIIGGSPKRSFVYYRCRLNEYPGTQLMTIHYENRDGIFHVTEVRGPHIPND